MIQMEYYFIINPISGKINKQLLEKNIREACLKRQVYVHKENRWCTVSGKKIPDEECVVFSVGGDGNLKTRFLEIFQQAVEMILIKP